MNMLSHSQIPNIWLCISRFFFWQNQQSSPISGREHWKMFIQCNLSHQFCDRPIFGHHSKWNLTISMQRRYITTSSFPSLIRLALAINESNVTVADNIYDMDPPITFTPYPIFGCSECRFWVYFFCFCSDFSFEKKKMFYDSNMRMISLLTPSSPFCWCFIHCFLRLSDG